MTYFANTLSLAAQYTTAQTDTPIILATGTQRIYVTLISAAIDQAVTVNGVGYRIGFGSPSTPNTVGVILRHSGLMPGDKQERGTGAGIVGSGDLNEDLRITCDNPVGGAIDVIVSYYIEEQT